MKSHQAKIILFSYLGISYICTTVNVNISNKDDEHGYPPNKDYEHGYKPNEKL